MRRSAGHMEMGVPLVLMAILGGLVLGNFWESMAIWGRVVSVVVLALFGLAGLASLGGPSLFAKGRMDDVGSDDSGRDDA